MSRLILEISYDNGSVVTFGTEVTAPDLTDLGIPASLAK